MPAHRADIIRIKLLEKYGGVWIDSDFIAMNSFDTLIEVSQRRHTLFYYRDSWQATNGILITPPQHSMIIEWSRKIDCVYSNLKRLQRIPTPNDGWCSFGADQLKVCIENAIDNHQNLGWDRVQLIPYDQLHRYFIKNPPHDLRDHAWPGCYGYMLFNTGFPDWFKKESAETILKESWLISLLFRLGLGLEKF
jgi:mannosyltransferase OCH1-like enzyme